MARTNNTWTQLLWFQWEIYIIWISYANSSPTIKHVTPQVIGVSIVYLTVCSGANQRKQQKLRVTGLCGGIPPMTGGFLSQRASNAENIVTPPDFFTFCTYYMLYQCDSLSLASCFNNVFYNKYIIILLDLKFWKFWNNENREKNIQSLMLTFILWQELFRFLTKIYKV